MKTKNKNIVGVAQNMRIGIDALFIRPGKVGGTESYLRNLINGLIKIDNDNEFFIFLSSNTYNTFNISKHNFKLIKCNVNSENKLNRLFYQNLILPSLIKKYNLDIIFFPTYTRCYSNLKNVISISNIHDLQFKHYPEYFSSVQKLIFKIFYNVSIRKSDYIVSISNFVKEDIIKFFGYSFDNKIKVIYNPIDFISENENNNINILNKYNIKSKQYILSVASLLPHKNLDTLIKAFKIFVKREINYSNYKLVLVGPKLKSENYIANLINELKLQDKIIITGFVSNKDLIILYKNAKLFVSPSKFEGFGMPPVEAMYYKIPVITTNLTSLPEVTLNKAYYYEPAENESELVNIIISIIENYPDILQLEYISNIVYQKYNILKIAEEYKEFFKYVYKKRNK
jgi:glycosyltransferase involved in cell wall biosynthesis